MPPAVVAGAIVVGAAVGGYMQYRGAQAQARAAERAARSGGNSVIAAAQIQADASRESMKMQTDAMREASKIQEKIAKEQMEQMERQGVREEIRMVTGQAAKDSFEKVSQAFLSWTEVRNFSEESDFAAKAGLPYEAPPKELNTWELTHTDLLTGESIQEENPYRLTGDMEKEAETLEAREELLEEEFERLEGISSKKEVK